MHAMSPDWIAHFNRGDYIKALLALETTWLRERDAFHKGLIRMCAGLNQVRLGLDSGPQFLLTSARALLDPFRPIHHGIDLDTLDRYLSDALQLVRDQPNQPRTLSPLHLLEQSREAT